MALTLSIPVLRRSALSLVAGLLVPAAASAQLLPTADASRYRNAVSTNVLGAAFGIYSVEYARVAGERFAVGGSATWVGERANELLNLGWGDDGERQLLADLKLHFYPERTPLEGAWVALHLGAYGERYARHDPTAPDIPVVGHGWRVAPTAAFSGGYALRLGDAGRVVAIGGMGCKTTLGHHEGLEGPFLLMLNLSVGGLF